jgi:hypothetical protein
LARFLAKETIAPQGNKIECERDCLASKGNNTAKSKQDGLPYMIAAAGLGGRVDKASVKKNRRHRQKQFLASVFFVKTRFRRSNKGGPR